MKKSLIFTILAFSIIVLPILGFLSFQSEEENIIKKLDQNLTFESIYYQGSFEIIRNNNKILKTFECWAKNENFLILFTNPEDKGVIYMFISPRQMMF